MVFFFYEFNTKRCFITFISHLLFRRVVPPVTSFTLRKQEDRGVDERVQSGSDLFESLLVICCHQSSGNVDTRLTPHLIFDPLLDPS